MLMKIMPLIIYIVGFLLSLVIVPAFVCLCDNLDPKQFFKDEECAFITFIVSFIWPVSLVITILYLMRGIYFGLIIAIMNLIKPLIKKRNKEESNERANETL